MGVKVKAFESLRDWIYEKTKLEKSEWNYRKINRNDWLFLERIWKDNWQHKPAFGLYVKYGSLKLKNWAVKLIWNQKSSSYNGIKTTYVIIIS